MKKKKNTPQKSTVFWEKIKYICAAVIFIAGLFIIVNNIIVKIKVKQNTKTVIGWIYDKGTKNTYLGGDGKSYFINAKQMKEYFTKKWGHGIPSRRTKIINGIIYQTGFPNPNVSGHIDIVYRRYTYGHYYEGSNITTTLWH